MQNKNIKKLWNRNQKRFITDFSIMQTTNSDGIIEHTYFERNSDRELIRLSTCQIEEVNCTGSQDKNGKLIFEGDIFAVDNEGCYIVGIVKYDDEFARFYIHEYGEEEEWNGLHDETKRGYFDKYDFDDYNYVDGKINLEVIGNEYENPELLNLEVQA